MSKPLYKRLIAKSEREADRYTKQLSVSLRAVAKEILKELKAKPKFISQMYSTTDNLKVFVNVQLFEEPNPEIIAEIKQTLQKHARFAQVGVSFDSPGFSVYMYVLKPYSKKEVS